MFGRKNTQNIVKQQFYEWQTIFLPLLRFLFYFLKTSQARLEKVICKNVLSEKEVN